MDQLPEGIFALLPAGAQNAGQNLIRSGAIPRAVATPGLAGHHHHSDGPLAYIVGGLQTGTTQKREQVRLLVP